MSPQKILELVHTHRAFVLYCIIGATGASLDFLIFALLYNLLHVNPLIATSISISAGIINNFLLNRHFNFKIKDNAWRRFASFYAVGLFGILISIAVIAILHEGFNISPNLAKLISIPIVTVVQFFLNSRISFASKTSSAG